MSVEIYGPKGYDFQYLNTLLIALEYLVEDDVEIYIEKSNGEDAEISFNKEGGSYTIDIQVKNRSDEVDFSTFAQWIAHFESQSKNCCLLNKLDTNEYRYAVFITDARSKDDVSRFTDEGIVHSKLNTTFNDKYLDLKEISFWVGLITY